MRDVRAALGVAVLGLALVLAALAAPVVPEPVYARYVAFGDSFTAAPYVPRTDEAGGCLRSRSNYPGLVARELAITTLVDRSCTGARTADLAGVQVTRRGTRIAPQLTGLDDRTDLVTVGLGFNDGRLYGRIASRCRQLRTVCRLADERELLQGIVVRAGRTLTRALTDIEQRAPRARVLLVGYPRLLPESGDCAALPRMREADREVFRYLNAELHRQMELAAGVAGVEYVDFYAASRGHDICSAEPWVEGRSGAPRRAAPMHPLPEGQEALADLVLATLRTPRES